MILFEYMQVIMATPNDRVRLSDIRIDLENDIWNGSASMNLVAEKTLEACTAILVIVLKEHLQFQ